MDADLIYRRPSLCFEEEWGMFFMNKRGARTYDRENQKPVIRASICTGEKVAGFQDVRTGKFTDIMLIRTPGDLEEFRRLYGLEGEEIATLY